MLKKRIIIISIVVILMVISYISFSLALFQKPVAQQGSNVISTTDCLSISITNVNSPLNITNGYPMKDTIGLNKEPYTFSITNGCSHYMAVDIGFEKASTSTLASDQFKVALNQNGKGKINYDLFGTYPLGVAINEGEARVLLHTALENNETKTFDFRMWIDHEQTETDVNDKGLTGNIIVTGTIKTKPGLACTDENHSTLVQGNEYVNGQYTYRYMQQAAYDDGYCDGDGCYEWQNITADGWGVVLTDSFNNVAGGDTSETSTTSVTTPLCSTINGKPIVSMNSTFYGSQATSIDLSSFDTSKVIDMKNMFSFTKTTNLDVSSFDTSEVRNMENMFSFASSTVIDVSHFDTANVTDMSGMFYNTAATNLDISDFDTSKVTNMSYMFNGSYATILDLSNFDTSNVTDMAGMFGYSAATSLNLSSFDTSNVTTMNRMFLGSSATSIDLSSFDTSKVTNMANMFSNSAATSLNLSPFDTSNVTDMSDMFNGSQATSIDLSSFDTSNVTDMSAMFYNSKATTLDLSSFDTSNIRMIRMALMFQHAVATTGYARTQADADKLNSTSYKPAGLTFVVKP